MLFVNNSVLSVQSQSTTNNTIVINSLFIVHESLLKHINVARNNQGVIFQRINDNICQQLALFAKKYYHFILSYY